MTLYSFNTLSLFAPINPSLDAAFTVFYFISQSGFCLGLCIMLRAVICAATHDSQIIARAEKFRIFLAEKLSKQRTWQVSVLSRVTFDGNQKNLFFIDFDLSPCLKWLKRVEVVKSFIVDFTALTLLLIVRSIFHALTTQFCHDFAKLVEFSASMLWRS